MAGCKGDKAGVFCEQNGKFVHKVGEGCGLFGLGYSHDALEFVGDALGLVGVLIDFSERKFAVFPFSQER